VKMTLTKAEIVESLISDTDLPPKEAKEFVDSFYEELVSALENGFDVRLSGFGNLILKDKTSRPGRNPKTGEDVMISARRVVTFKPGQKMKNFVQDNLSHKN
jgi:integration host factor subunit alpha